MATLWSMLIKRFGFNTRPKVYIYSITKITAELLCKDYFEKEIIETTVLRFLPENEKAIRRLYRGLDEQDDAIGHILALERTFKIFEIYNISNESPFKKSDLSELMTNPKEVIKRYYPSVESIFTNKNWIFPKRIDRVYSIEKAKSQLNYRPTNNFDTFIDT